MPKPTAFSAFALVMLLTVPARAAGLHCDIPRNEAGFVALQAKPSARAQTVARMKAGDEVELLQGLKGKWVEVLHWHGQDRKTAARAGDTRRGWVEARLIGACGEPGL